MAYAPDKNFRMKQSTKIMMAMSTVKKHDRHYFKDAMILAQLAEEAAKRAALRSKEHTKGKEAE
jgi:hypothetical protein